MDHKVWIRVSDWKGKETVISFEDIFQAKRYIEDMPETEVLSSVSHSSLKRYYGE